MACKSPCNVKVGIGVVAVIDLCNFEGHLTKHYNNMQVIAMHVSHN